MFSSKLFKLKRQALMEYSVLQYCSSKEFHQYWIEEENTKLVNSMNPSALADYSAVYEIVSSIRMAPLNPKGVAVMASIIIAPFLPLVFAQSSVKEVMLTIGSSIL